MSNVIPDIRIRVSRDSPNVSMTIEKGGAYYPDYSGEYEFTPQDVEQVIQTKKKVLLDNIIIRPIPQNYGLITYNGSFITVS